MIAAGRDIGGSRLGEAKAPLGALPPGYTLWGEEVKKASPACPVEWLDSEDPAFLLYTSGSTGKPKGVIHTTGGYMVYAASTFKHVFDYRDGDVYWCARRAQASIARSQDNVEVPSARGRCAR